jgi:hypothetical protein
MPALPENLVMPQLLVQAFLDSTEVERLLPLPEARHMQEVLLETTKIRWPEESMIF